MPMECLGGGPRAWKDLLDIDFARCGRDPVIL